MALPDALPRTPDTRPVADANRSFIRPCAYDDKVERSPRPRRAGRGQVVLSMILPPRLGTQAGARDHDATILIEYYRPIQGRRPSAAARPGCRRVAAGGAGRGTGPGGYEHAHPLRPALALRHLRRPQVPRRPARPG